MMLGLRQYSKDTPAEYKALYQQIPGMSVEEVQSYYDAFSRKVADLEAQRKALVAQRTSMQATVYRAKMATLDKQLGYDRGFQAHFLHRLKMLDAAPPVTGSGTPGVSSAAPVGGWTAIRQCNANVGERPKCTKSIPAKCTCYLPEWKKPAVFRPAAPDSTGSDSYTACLRKQAMGYKIKCIPPAGPSLPPAGPEAPAPPTTITDLSAEEQALQALEAQLALLEGQFAQQPSMPQYAAPSLPAEPGYVQPSQVLTPEPVGATIRPVQASQVTVSAKANDDKKKKKWLAAALVGAALLLA